MRFSSIPQFTRSLCIFVACFANAHGLVDSNSNGFSDIWEMEHNNGLLLSSNNADHATSSDPDKDGWNNAQECLAGTNPFDGSIPRGKTTLRITQALQKSTFEVYWSVIPGKNYRLQTSTDLKFWAYVGPWIAAEQGQSQRSLGLQTSNPNDTNAPAPTRIYWRIKVADIDTDLDGLSNTDEFILGMNPNQSQTSPGISDQLVVNYYMENNPGGLNGQLPSNDTDGDGLNSFQEFSLKTDSNKADTDDDGKPDGQDAVPLDKEIDWNKVDELRYTWSEQVVQVSAELKKHRPIAINSQEQILFRDSRAVSSIGFIQEQKNLWNSTSGQWVNLPLSGSQAIKVGTTDVVMGEPVIEFIDINDDGVIYGLGRGENYTEVDPILPGMVWKRSGTSLTAYAPPKYFFPLYPFPAPAPPASWSTSIVDNSYTRNQGEWNTMFGGIANDGTINAICSGTGVGTDVWMNYASSGNTVVMTTVKDLGPNLQVSQTFPAAVLDVDNSLCVERAQVANGVFQSKVWLKEGTNQTDISFMTDELVETAELQKTPNTKKDGTKRLWVAIQGECFVEKPITANGQNRWHKPTSMDESIIRLSNRGIAITSGDIAANAVIPPKLWRNGKYFNMNDLITRLAGSDLVITKAIDLSSTGVILVQATENGVTKTGLLMPIR